ncbi:MAG TPA: tripartite tricarboxylate transporter substrate binding protein [Casimicrobiaceae bacterium]|nr:tripartite tricarboxylate transporter substrate binding protein [Casimicrobiaceae bacterium]
MIRRLFVGLLAIALLACAALAQAQGYPTRPIRVVVPFSPGGAVDGPMRVVAQAMAKSMGQPVVVENKPGAGATMGADVVAKSLPDGYTLLLASQTNVISASLYSKLPYDAMEDFAPVSLIGREPGVLVVNPSVPAKTFPEFVAYVQARPGKVDYASSGNGSGQHLFMALLASTLGLKMNHVPYRGSGQATTDLIAGVVQASIPGTAGMVGHIRAGKLRALAVTGAQRSPQLPDLPTLIESGVPGYEAYVWMGLMAPKGTPAPIVDKLNGEVLKALATDSVKTYMANAGIEIVGSSAVAFGTFYRAEKERWAKVIKETGAKVD